eukprot:UN32068
MDLVEHAYHTGGCILLVCTFWRLTLYYFAKKRMQELKLQIDEQSAFDKMKVAEEIFDMNRDPTTNTLDVYDTAKAFGVTMDFGQAELILWKLDSTLSDSVNKDEFLAWANS